MSLTLDSLLEHALRNENLHRRYQALELSLIGAPDFAGFLAVLRDELPAVLAPRETLLVVNNLLDVIAGREPTQKFDGYTSCPLLLREGAALLVEFDYENRLIPSLPMIDPLQDSYFAWVMKYRLLKPAYMAVAKGRV